MSPGDGFLNTYVKGTDTDDARYAFHAHLDICKRCESQPFNLCPMGASLLRVAATTLVPPSEGREIP